MAEDSMTLTTIALVIESWEEAREKHGFEDIVGPQMFKFLFQIDPKLKTIFGLKRGFQATQKNMKLMGITSHAVRVFNMLHRALSLTGPPDALFRMLDDLGHRHSKYGVQPQMFPLMTKAFLMAMKDWLGKQRWTDELQTAWETVLGLVTDRLAEAASIDGENSPTSPDPLSKSQHRKQRVAAPRRKSCA